MSDQNTKILWEPSQERIRESNIIAFIEAIESDWKTNIDDFEGLYEFSVQESEKFWQSLISFAGVIAETWGENVIKNPGNMPGAVWFPDANLNYAENLLRRKDNSDALVFWGEDQVKLRFSHKELFDEVSRVAQAMRAKGIVAGDRVGGYMPNMPQTIIAMLAAVSIGAIWSSCSPDFGVQGVLDRFGQIEPKMIFVCDGYFYNGKAHDILEKTSEILRHLPSVKFTVVVPYCYSSPVIEDIFNGISWDNFVADYDVLEIEFARLPFNHPLYIMYSSGTTGVPKCIIHGAGGTLLKHLSEHLLHSDEKPGDRVFYFTTCGWMMWNWLVSGLATEATLLLYDGSPFYPDGNVLFDFAAEEKMTIFGTSAKFIDAAAKAGIRPRDTHDLSTLKTILSTGSPLMPESFDYVYDAIKADVCLSSIAGGTDIVSCFVGGHPGQPVWRGEIQAKGLGMKVEVRDDQGNVLGPGEKGELTCSKSFPSMPIRFWNDPTGDKYHAAYFDKFPGLWCHGDYVAETDHGGLVIYGRSDAVLNPGGVRIGTAEIYREAEQIDEVIESLVVGQQRAGDVRVVLFVRLREGISLTDDLRDQIRKRIRSNTTPRHVPEIILDVPDIPRTKSGKIVELAVQRVLHGEAIKNLDALANPEALDYFRDRPELAS